MALAFLAAWLMLLAVADPAGAKLCPAGRFEIVEVRGRFAESLRGASLRLADDTAAVEGLCAAAPLRPRMHYDGLLFRMRARWRDCAAGPVALRARFARPCDTLRGVIRLRGGGKARFVAQRTPFCGNGTVETGEACDDGNLDAGDCCGGDCRAEPGCFVACERTADCAATAICVRQEIDCQGPREGTCLPAAMQPCATFPVCGCDGRTYATTCDAWAAGVAVRYGTACY